MKSRYHSPRRGACLTGRPHCAAAILLEAQCLCARFNSIEAVRGCPHRCDFCVVPTAWGSIYAYRPVEEVIAELEHV